MITFAEINMAARMKDSGMLNTQIARKMGVADATVRDYLKINMLDDYIKDYMKQGYISVSAKTANILLGLCDQDKRKLVEVATENLLTPNEINEEAYKITERSCNESLSGMW